MKNEDLLKKAMEFAKKGNGRRLLNTLSRKDNALTLIELDGVLKIYCEKGLPKEVEMLKQRRGILGDDQYNALAEKVRENCCSEKYGDFAVSLGNLLRSGMRMNPTKTNFEGLA